jgi:hypothetical protein
LLACLLLLTKTNCWQQQQAKAGKAKGDGFHGAVLYAWSEEKAKEKGPSLPLTWNDGPSSSESTKSTTLEVTNG